MNYNNDIPAGWVRLQGGFYLFIFFLLLFLLLLLLFFLFFFLNLYILEVYFCFWTFPDLTVNALSVLLSGIKIS